MFSVVRKYTRKWSENFYSRVVSIYKYILFVFQYFFPFRQGKWVIRRLYFVFKKETEQVNWPGLERKSVLESGIQSMSPKSCNCA